MHDAAKTIASENSEERIPKLLFVDDEGPILKSLTRFTRNKNWDVSIATSGEEGLKVLKSEPDMDVVVSDMRMPGMSGSEFLIQVRENYPKCIRILLTGYADMASLEKAINGARIYNYLTKPWDEYLLNEVLEGALRYQNSERERERLQELTKKQNRQLGKLALSLDKQVKERTIEIDQALTLLQMTNDRVTTSFYDALKVLNHVIEWKEGRDSGHSRFVANYAVKVAKKAGFSEEDTDHVKSAGFLHRIGMLGLPDELQSKPLYLLEDDEKLVYQNVPVCGEMALASAPSLKKVAKLIRHQHESPDGKGYPDALALQEIPPGACIIGMVTDFYDVYNGKMERNLAGVEDAREYLTRWAGKKYDKTLVDIFLETLEGFGDNCLVRQVLAVDKLEAEMLLDADVVTKSGVLLLTKSTQLSQATISTLKNYEKQYQENFSVSVIIDQCQEEQQ